jgi:hypothetical protein
VRHVSTSARIVSGGNSFGACRPANAGVLVVLVGLGRTRVLGKATDNVFADLCNNRVRQECLNAYWFLSLDDARCKIETWQGEYDTVPHSVIGHLPPADQVQLLAVVVCPQVIRKPDLLACGGRKNGPGTINPGLYS